MLPEGSQNNMPANGGLGFAPGDTEERPGLEIGITAVVGGARRTRRNGRTAWACNRQSSLDTEKPEIWIWFRLAQMVGPPRRRGRGERIDFGFLQAETGRRIKRGPTALLPLPLDRGDKNRGRAGRTGLGGNLHDRFRPRQRCGVPDRNNRDRRLLNEDGLNLFLDRRRNRNLLAQRNLGTQSRLDPVDNKAGVGEFDGPPEGKGQRKKKDKRGGKGFVGHRGLIPERKEKSKHLPHRA